MGIYIHMRKVVIIIVFFFFFTEVLMVNPNQPVAIQYSCTQTYRDSHK